MTSLSFIRILIEGLLLSNPSNTTPASTLVMFRSETRLQFVATDSNEAARIRYTYKYQSFTEYQLHDCTCRIKQAKDPISRKLKGAKKRFPPYHYRY